MENIINARELLGQIADNNKRNRLGEAAKEIKSSLPSEIRLTSEQMRVVYEFLNGYYDLAPINLGSKMQQALNVMIVVNFIILVGERIREQEC